MSDLEIGERVVALDQYQGGPVAGALGTIVTVDGMGYGVRWDDRYT